MLLVEPECREAFVVAPEDDWDVIATTCRTKRVEPTVSPSGLTVTFEPQLSQMVVSAPSDWTIKRIRYSNPDRPDLTFAVDAILSPPDVKLKVGSSESSTYVDTDRFEAIDFKDVEFRAVSTETGEECSFRVPVFPDNARPRDPLENWPDISENEDDERAKLDKMVKPDRLAVPAVGNEAPWKPSPYRLTASEAKRSLRAARADFAEAHGAVEVAARIGATQLSLEGRQDEAAKVMAALEGLRSDAMAREVQAHRLGIYGKLTELAENEWSHFQQARGGRKAARTEDDGTRKRRDFEIRVQRTATELIKENPDERVLKSTVAVRLAGSPSTCSETYKRQVARTIDRLIDADQLPAQPFQTRKTDT